jgi:hypothetical protein
MQVYLFSPFEKQKQKQKEGKKRIIEVYKLQESSKAQSSLMNFCVTKPKELHESFFSENKSYKDFIDTH